MENNNTIPLITEDRLKAIAAKEYPIDDNWCAFKKQSQTYKQNAFVWRMLRELRHLTENQVQIVLRELESKKVIQ